MICLYFSWYALNIITETEVYLNMWWVSTFLCSSVIMCIFAGSFRLGIASGGGEQEEEVCLLERVRPSLKILPLLSVMRDGESTENYHFVTRTWLVCCSSVFVFCSWVDRKQCSFIVSFILSLPTAPLLWTRTLTTGLNGCGFCRADCAMQIVSRDWTKLLKTILSAAQSWCFFVL